MVDSRTERFNNRFFNVALCNNIVVATASCGKLFIWNLPIEKQEEYCGFMTTPSEAPMETLTETYTKNVPTLRRTRSKSINAMTSTGSAPTSTATPQESTKPRSGTLISSAPTTRPHTPKKNKPSIGSFSLKASSSGSSRKTSPRSNRSDEK